MNVDDLTIHGLGFSADRPLKKRKFNLTACIAELLEHGIIELGKGHSGPQDLFIKRGKGLYVVQFFEGPYFRQPEAGRNSAAHQQLTEDPLYQPLHSVGVDTAAIRRLFKHHSREAIQRWIRITDAAMHEKPQGFPGFRTSPAAFLIDGIQNNRMPPDWIYAHDKEAKRRRWEAERSAGIPLPHIFACAKLPAKARTYLRGLPRSHRRRSRPECGSRQTKNTSGRGPYSRALTEPRIWSHTHPGHAWITRGAGTTPADWPEIASDITTPPGTAARYIVPAVSMTRIKATTRATTSCSVDSVNMTDAH